MHKYFTLHVILFLGLIPFLALAAPPAGPFIQTAVEPITIVDNVLKFVSSVFLFGAVIFMIYAGYMYLSASGDPKKIETAHENLKWGLMGIAIGLLAYVFPEIIKKFIEDK